LKPHQLECLKTVFGTRLNIVRAMAQGVSDERHGNETPEASGTAAF